ncbi:MAG TPA: TasA family protein [Gaiellaceae bacterium]|nr:TasA family protein [Gaiellaceae bacterium]
MRLPLYVKVVMSVAILGAAAGVASLATFASFTSSTSAQAQSLSSGTVSITLGAANRLTVGASNLVPGDTIQRAVDITNNGSAGTSSVGSVTLTTTASPSSLLDSDTTNGLQMVIDKCSVAWTESGPPYTYVCGGTTTSVVASRAVIGANIAMSNMSSITAGNTDHLRVTLTLPATSSNTLQGQSSTLDYVFTANQRAATSQ